MLEFVWRLIARIASRPAVADWIIRRAQRTPYYPITSRDGTRLYMDRWWLFNAYSKDAEGNAGPPRWSWLPSVRVHHICVPDDDEHMHDHPWDARTIVLRGWYEEERPLGAKLSDMLPPMFKTARLIHARPRGYTGPVLHGSYHRISHVSYGGVYTLWFTWQYRGTWGFLVDGVKVPWREYLAGRPRA